jgi:hypothetical protein
LARAVGATPSRRGGPVDVARREARTEAADEIAASRMSDLSRRAAERASRAISPAPVRCFRTSRLDGSAAASREGFQAGPEELAQFGVSELLQPAL